MNNSGLLLTGCSQDTEIISIKSNGQDSEVNYIEEKNQFIETEVADLNIDLESVASRLNIIDVDSSVQIIYMDNDCIYYSIDKETDIQKDARDKSFYVYDIKKERSIFITEVKNIVFQFGNAIVKGNKIYYPITKSDNTSSTLLSDFAIVINKEDYSHRFIDFGDTFTPDMSLHTTDNAIYRFHQKDIGQNATTFYLNKFNEYGKVEEIFSTEYKDNAGSILASVCSDNNYIYTYSLLLESGEENPVIEMRNQNGNIINTFIPEWSSFLFLEEINDNDIMYKMYKNNNILVFQTLNSRICMYQIQGENLIGLRIPKELEEFVYGARYITDYNESSNFIFMHRTLKTEEFYIFYVDKLFFQRVTFTNFKGVVKTMARDNLGNFVVITATDNDEVTLYYLKIDEINKK